jgi:hypothetical protein
MRLLLVLFFSVFSVVSVVNSAFAHPVPRQAHDRTIVVTLTPEALLVNYRVEVDDWTVVYIDLPAIDDRVDVKSLMKPKEFYDAFVQGYASIFTDNLTATLDGQPLTFTCEKREHQLIDHLRCDFVFRAPWRLKADKVHQLSFHEGNYLGEPGRIHLSLAADVALQIVERTEPDEALKNRSPVEYKPGDEARLRKASAKFALGWKKSSPSSVSETTDQPAETPSTWLGLAALLGLTVVFLGLAAVRRIVRLG